MPAETRNVHLRSKEFLYKNWHYQPGWYFFDEEEDLYGPFLSEAHCEAGLKLYIIQLMAGGSPTQLSVAEKQKLLKSLAENSN